MDPNVTDSMQNVTQTKLFVTKTLTNPQMRCIMKTRKLLVTVAPIYS